ncbi:protein-disulfide isomerase [Scopulibacillus daqui]|uniref:Protein-disulfide isomerase n=1 Tax=Scopulibacillus daqui TaxID=1469162 RepID=A0ABS2PX62_9BACL|nr:thioredoxin domain-containing protein [Scopulibacillus daqui]MBM7644653.1 protein-disulfide isomerase [Scopulibacillus daqui]
MANNHEKRLKEQRKRERENQKQKRRQRQMIVISTIIVVVLIAGIVAIVLQNINKNKTAEPSPNAGKQTQTKAAINYNGQPMMGQADAPVRIAEFGDYKCIYCKKFEETIVPKLKKDFIDTGKAKFYFINDTIFGENSQLAANAAEAVFHQDPKGFWAFHQKLYKSQGPEDKNWVTKELLLKIAKETVPSIDMNKLRNDINNMSYQDDIVKDYSMAQNIGVKGTPALYINGKQVDPFNYQEIKEAIKEAANE